MLRWMYLSTCALALVLFSGCTAKDGKNTKNSGAAKQEPAAENIQTPAALEEQRVNAQRRALFQKDAPATTSSNSGHTTQAAKGKEVVFDPKNPPAGYTMCHRNHCHKTDGGVASYAQVMAEMGATSIVGQPKRQPPPPAPADVAAPPADAQTTASGLKTKMLKAGNGTAKPTAESVVQLEFTAWTTDGKAFYSSIAEGRPMTLPVAKLGMDGFTEGVLLMTVGEERRIWIPENLAFKGRPGAPAGMIVMDIELLEIK